jgi:asparagine synthase (glutamine-hydrolysing)
MSAIFGLFRFDGGAVSRSDLERMQRVLQHLGSDGSHLVLAGGVGLGHCLARVNTEDSFESQPVHDSERDLTLVADVRLDNREELAAALSLSTSLRNIPDSTLILHAYVKWGADCAGHLLGDFAFAIWDGRARKLVLGRDHMGQRFVHWHYGQGFFAFATEIKALWTHPDVPRALSEAGVGRLLLKDFSRREGATYFDGISGLPGGTTLSIHADGRRLSHRYWHPAADPAHLGRGESHYIEAYRSVLGEAVACRVRRLQRAPGIVFSGGYDSAAVAGLAGPLLQKAHWRLVAAASVMPAGYAGTIRHARNWIELCARDMPWLDIRYVTREGRSVLTDFDRKLVERDIPRGSYGFVQDELFATLSGAGVRLVLDGHGGDYTLNPRGQAALARFLATGQLRRFLRELRARVRLSEDPLMSILRHEVAGMIAPQWLSTAWTRIRRGRGSRWRDHPIDTLFADSLIARGAVDPTGPNALPQTAMRERLKIFIATVLSMPTPGGAVEAGYHGLVLTKPFHDKRVVELALAIPEDFYVKDGRNRYLACAALKDVYPLEFQTRWRRNDDQAPDFLAMAKSIEPQLLAEIARIESSETLGRYFDFPKMRELLLARSGPEHNSGWERETQLAVMGFLAARYVEWFQRSNR